MMAPAETFQECVFFSFFFFFFFLGGFFSVTLGLLLKVDFFEIAELVEKERFVKVVFVDYFILKLRFQKM